MKRCGFKEGFTLVELSLSIAFIAILSIAIVMVINNTITSYRWGLTLNQLNSTGMDLVDDLRTAAQNSSSELIDNICSRVYVSGEELNKCLQDNAHNFVAVVRTDRVIIGEGTANRETVNNAPVFGAFCTGSYSYIWNSGYYMSSEYKVQSLKPAGIKYRNADGRVETIYSENKPFKLLKIEDEDRSVCVSAVKAVNSSKYYVNNNNSTPNMFDISSTAYPVIAEEPIDILANGGSNNMAIYDLMARTADNDSNDSLFYTVSFILGTVQGGINVVSNGNNCATPNESAIENSDYCSINKFNFATQANGA